MALWTAIHGFATEHSSIARLVGLGIVGGVMVLLFRTLFNARKIQPNGFKWKTLRNEVIFAITFGALTGYFIGFLTSTLNHFGLIEFKTGPASWWVVALEYALYFFAFDTWFYWMHRLMHKEPMYTLVHKIHHLSTSPSAMTTFSVNPLESLINGGFVSVFTAVVTVHHSTMALIVPTNVIMGVYVHLGYEFFPRWWHKSLATKWFITTTFHDQHHRYFTFNYGGYTTIWDRICGTIRPKFEVDFDKLKARLAKPREPIPLPARQQ